MDTDDHVETIHDRFRYLEVLAEGQLHKPELVDRLNVSRSTVDRAIRELENAGFVEKGKGGYTATLTGRIAYERHRTYRREVDALVDAQRVLDPLPAAVEFDVDAITGAESILGTEQTPYQPREAMADTIRDAETYRAVLPTLPDPKHLRQLYEHVVTQGNPAELILPRELLDPLREELPVRLPVMADSDGFSLFVGDVPEFGVMRTGAGAESTVSTLVFTSGGNLHGLMRNRSPEAVAWADRFLNECRSAATEETGQFADDAGTPPDGGVRLATAGEIREGSAPESRLVTLEREGFVRLDRDFLADRSIVDPASSWRAGLDLPAVQAGYAVERTDGTDDERSFDQSVVDRLRDGNDCVIVGPPGSGKSTVCKRIACEWYRDGSPVFYRESGTGRPFDSTDALIAAVRESDGRPLIVVEDAVRAETVAIYDAMATMEGEAAVFLLDARRSEWQDPPVTLDPETESRRHAVETVAIPPLSEADYERIVDRFERTVGRSIAVPLERLRAEISTEAQSDEAAPDEVLLLLHRLSLYADPLNESVTNLEEDVAAVYDDLAAAGDLELDVGVLVNVLNAAGIEIRPGYVHSIADPGHHDAVREAIERLTDRVLFPESDGSYRTVHESWSVAFLDHLLETAGADAASERFGRVLTAFLSLADDRSCRERIADVVDDVEDVAAGPDKWVEDVIERVYALGRERPKLASLYGPAEAPCIELPNACPQRTRLETTNWLGEMFVDGGQYDRGETVLERQLEQLAGAEEPTLEAEARFQLGIVATERSEHERARQLFERALELAQAVENLTLVASVHRSLGKIAVDQAEYDTARDHTETALEIARNAGSRTVEGSCLNQLGLITWRRGESPRAKEYYDRALEVARDNGNRTGEANCLRNHGLISYDMGEYDEAREYCEQALEITRSIGDRKNQAANLELLGVIARQRGNYGRAAESFEGALEIDREMGNHQGEVTSLNNVGNVAVFRGDFERARKCFEKALEIARDIDFPTGAGTSLTNLGSLFVQRGVYDEAREFHEQALELARETGERRPETDRLDNLGTIARRQGHYQEAEAYHRQAVEIARDIEYRTGEANNLIGLGAVVAERGPDTDAGEHLEAGLEIAREVGNPEMEIDARRHLAALARKRGEYDRTRDHLDAALDADIDDMDPSQLGQLRLELAQLAFDRDDLESAREHLETALEAFGEIETPHWLGRCRTLQGRIASAADDEDGARERWRSALETFEEIGAQQDALAVLECLVELEYSGGETERAREWCGRARSLLNDAPEPVVTLHEEWVEQYSVSLEEE